MRLQPDLHGHWARIVVTGEAREGVSLDEATLVALGVALDALGGSPSLRCLILDIDDCLGAPLSQLARAEPAALRDQAAAFLGLLRRLHEGRTPALARVRGRIMGGAVGLASACDILLCRSDVRFSLPEAGAGMAPILIEPWLTRRIGPSRFREWAMSGREVDAEEACRIGLADGIDDSDGFPAAYVRILRSAPAAFGEIKRLSRLEIGEAPLEAFMAYVGTPSVRADIALIAEGGSPDWRRKTAARP